MNVIHTYPICHVCIYMWPTAAVASHYIIYYIVGKYSMWFQMHLWTMDYIYQIKITYKIKNI